MTRISIIVDSSECPNGFDYVLGCVGRKADEIAQTGVPMFRGEAVNYVWNDVMPVEIDRFIMLCKLHDYRDVEVVSKYVQGVTGDDAKIVTLRKGDVESFFEVYPEGEAPAVEHTSAPVEVAPAPAPAPAPVAVVPAPAPAPVVHEAPKANYTLNFFGWCSEDGHDKVWGYVTIGSDPLNRHTELYNFWGKRGKRLAFQKHEGVWGSDELQKRADQKTRSGRSSGAYMRVPVSSIESVVPGFFEELEKQLTLAKLFENFRGNTAA